MLFFIGFGLVAGTAARGWPYSNQLQNPTPVPNLWNMPAFAAAKKAQGVSLGGANAGTARTQVEVKQRAETLRAVFKELPDLSAHKIAAELNKRKMPTPNGGQWSAATVIRVQHRLTAD